MIHLPIYLCIVIIPDHSANDELPEIRSIFGECDMPAQLNNNSLESFSPTSGSRMPRSSQPHLQRQFLTTAQKQRERDNIMELLTRLSRHCILRFLFNVLAKGTGIYLHRDAFRHVTQWLLLYHDWADYGWVYWLSVKNGRRMAWCRAKQVFGCHVALARRACNLCITCEYAGPCGWTEHRKKAFHRKIG